jgi:hypothetical protein
VLTERKLDPQLVNDFALAERVPSAAPAGSAQLSLVPGALLPLVDAVGAPLDGRGLRVQSVVATGGGRFNLVEDDGVRVLGGGNDVLSNAGVGDVAVGAPQDAVAFDDRSDTTIATDFDDDGDATAHNALAAGDWLRVVKESDAGAVIEKIYIGRDAASGESGPSVDVASLNAAAETTLAFSPNSSALGPLRALSYLDPGNLSLDADTANPQDAYLLLYASGFVLVENGVDDTLSLQRFVAATDGVGSFDTSFDDIVDDAGVVQSAFAGACAAVEAIGGVTPFGVTDADDDTNGLERTEVAVCYDFAGGGVDVDLRDAEVLPGDQPLHLFADAAADRVLVFRLSALQGAEGALALTQQEVPVGREPVALSRSRLLDCSGGGVDVDVILVANAGSADVSVLRNNGVVEEIAVAALPEPPAGFVDDVLGTTCDDPFAWVIGADGLLFPIDMRGVPAVPLCDGAACRISSRGRARSGAIAHIEDHPARAVVGGLGLVGEIGFFRPAALPGGAFLGSSDLGIR